MSITSHNLAQTPDNATQATEVRLSYDFIKTQKVFMQQNLYLSPSAIFWIYQSQFNQATHLFYDDSLVYCHNSITASFVVQSNDVPCWERRLECEIRQKKHKPSRPLQQWDMHLDI